MKTLICVLITLLIAALVTSAIVIKNQNAVLDREQSQINALQSAINEQSDSAKQSGSNLSALRMEGYNQCVAGDEEGCHYYIDKLRDQGQNGDAEFLKANLIAFTSMNSSDLTAPDAIRFGQNKLPAAEIRGEAQMVAIQGGGDFSAYLIEQRPAWAPPLPSDAQPNNTPTTPNADHGITIGTKVSGAPPP
jgi:uncharacterized protein YxeA